MRAEDDGVSFRVEAPASLLLGLGSGVVRVRVRGNAGVWGRGGVSRITSNPCSRYGTPVWLTRALDGAQAQQPKKGSGFQQPGLRQITSKKTTSYHGIILGYIFFRGDAVCDFTFGISMPFLKNSKTCSQPPLDTPSSQQGLCWSGVRVGGTVSGDNCNDSSAME